MALLGTCHYLCRSGGGGGQSYFRLARGGGLNVFIKEFSGVSSLIVRYILRGVHWPRWVKQLNSRAQKIYDQLYKFLPIMLFVNFNHHNFVQLIHLYSTEILHENHLKRIIFCMVITFVFTMKVRFVKIYHFSYIYTLIL